MGHVIREKTSVVSTDNRNNSPVIYISPELARWPSLSELWQYRQFLVMLAWRDIKVRYKQTIVGSAWAIIQPFTTMIVFSFFFGRVVNVPSYNVPYPIFSFSALVPWTLFASSLGQNAQSVVSNRNLVSKVYFPKFVLPLSTTVGRLVDFSIAFVILLGMLAYFGIIPRIEALVVIPALTLLTVLTTLGIGFWLAAINVRYRDIQQIIPFLIQSLLFATPVIYPSDLLSKSERILYGINPMASVIEGFRWALLDIEAPPWEMFLISIVTTTILLVSGVWFFQRTQHTFVDVM